MTELLGVLSAMGIVASSMKAQSNWLVRLFRLVDLLKPRALAVVENGKGSLRQAGYFPLRVLAGYGGGEVSSGHVYSQFEKVLARVSKDRRSLEDCAAASVLQAAFAGSAKDCLGLALVPRSPTLTLDSRVWTSSDSAREAVSDRSAHFFCSAPRSTEAKVPRDERLGGLFDGLASNDTLLAERETHNIVDAADG